MSYSSISSSSEVGSDLSFPIPSSGNKSTLLSEREGERNVLHYSSPSSSEDESDISFAIPDSSNQTALSPENREERYAIHSQFPKPILIHPTRTRSEHPKPRRKIRFARDPSTRRATHIGNGKHAPKAKKKGFQSFIGRKSWLSKTRKPLEASIIDQANDSRSIESRDIATWKSKSKGTVTRRGLGMMSKAKTWNLQYWISYLFWPCVALLIQFIVGTSGWAFPHGGKSSESHNLPACSLSDEGDHHVRNKLTCELNETLQNGSQRLNFLSAFIVGGFLMNGVQLWTARRTAYCAVCGATRNLLVNLSTITPSADDKAVFVRWAVLGYELAVLKGRGMIDIQEGRTYLEDLHLIRGNEWESMVAGDRHTTVWFWIQAKAKMLMDEGAFDSICFQTICNAVTLSRDKANDLMSCIDRDQPPPYVFVCASLINLNLLLHSSATGLKWAIWTYDSGGLSIWTEPRMYVELLILISYTTIYAMLFDVCTIMYNPFGPRNIDIEHFKVGSGIRHLAKRLKTAAPPDRMNVSGDTMEASRTRISTLSDIQEDVVETTLFDAMESSSHRKLLGLSFHASPFWKGDKGKESTKRLVKTTRF